MYLKGLIFDVDGTLAETEELHRRAFNQAFEDFGTGWHWSATQYARLLSITGGRERIQHYAREQGREQGRRPPEGDPEEYFRSLHRCKSKHYLCLLRKIDLLPRPGVKRLLEECRGLGLRMALASSSARANVQQLLRLSLKIDRPTDYFQAIVSCDEVPEKKPSPKVYLRALELLGLTPRQCMVLEDSVNGHLAARRCELRTLVTVNALTNGQRFEDASLVVDQLGEPGQPFKVLAGAAHGHSLVTPELLEILLGAAPEKTAHPVPEQQDPAPATLPL